MKDIKKEIIVDIVFVVIIAICLAVVFAYCVPTWASEASHEATTPSTTAETTEYITEPTEEEQPTTQATEPSVTLYDVPLGEDLQLHIIETAEAHGIDPAIIMAMAFRESTYRPGAIGDGGKSFGLLQIQPRWHSKRMAKLNCPDLLDPFQNVTVGVDYLCELLNKYGDIGKALTAYNAGSYKGTVTKYARTVMAKAEELEMKS